MADISPALVPDLPPDVHRRILAELLKLEARWQELPAGKKRAAGATQCIRGAYDVIVRECQGARMELTDELLSDVTKGVCAWGISRGWIATQRPRRMTWRWADEPRPAPQYDRIPEDEIFAHVRGLLAGRITYWKAEALASGVHPSTEIGRQPATGRATPELGSPAKGRPPRLPINGAAVEAFREHLSLTQPAFARLLKISEDTVQALEAGSGSRKTLRKIVEYAKRRGYPLTLDILQKNPPQKTA
jgi:hypothetical protein